MQDNMQEQDMQTERLYQLFEQHPIVTTDTRDCPPGSIFFALKGETFDGNKFAKAALEKGCSYAVVDEAEYADSDDPRIILVGDCLTALQLLARHHRRTIGTRIIGVTGTNGKTTTKELIATVLGEKYNVLYTQGNFNNHIGVPKTLLRLTREHDIAVVEMGANHPGEIKTLTSIAEPDCGIITNVGKAHLEGFGSFEGVIRTKGELYDFLRTRNDSLAFVDGGNEHLLNIAKGLELVKYGIGDADDLLVSGEVVACDPFLRLRWRHEKGEWHEVNTHLIGSYNIYNMLAAACIGMHFGVSQQEIDHALSNYVPSNNRSQLTETEHNHLVVDTYNANPTSMDAALRNFRDMQVSPKMAILGDMRELGDSSLEEHRRVVDFLKSSGFDNVWLVGDQFGQADTSFRHFKDVEEVKLAIADQKPEGYYILIKGSNSLKLFELPPLL